MAPSIIGTPAPRSFKRPVHECGSPAVRFDGRWLCPSCQKVGPDGREREFTELFPSRRVRRGRATA